jgi:hypothetical protein
VEYVGLRSFPLPSKKGEPSKRAWQHLVKKYEKLRELRARLVDDQDLTPRIGQCVVGNGIWDTMVSQRPMYTIHPLIALIQDLLYRPDPENPSSPRNIVLWDLPMDVTTSQRQQLIDAVDVILLSETKPYTNTSSINLPSSPGESMEQQGLVYVCSDAELKQCGYVKVNTLSLDLCEAVTLQFPIEAETESWDINHKELWAAIYTINHEGAEHHHVVLGVDSAVARAWLRRGIASGEGAVAANRLLSTLNPKHRFTTLFLYSEDNLSDPTSRNKTIIGEYARYRATVQILTGSHQYWNSITDVPPPEAKLRNAKIQFSEMSEMELTRVKQSWERWSNHGFDVGVVEDWSVPQDADVEVEMDVREYSSRSRRPRSNSAQ